MQLFKRESGRTLKKIQAYKKSPSHMFFPQMWTGSMLCVSACVRVSVNCVCVWEHESAYSMFKSWRATTDVFRPHEAFPSVWSSGVCERVVFFYFFIFLLSSLFLWLPPPLRRGSCCSRARSPRQHQHCPVEIIYVEARLDIKGQELPGTHLGPKWLPFMQPLWGWGVNEQLLHN